MNLERKAIINDEKFLRQISTDVDFENDDFLQFISYLRSYCKDNKVYALSSAQIGIPKRIIYIKNTSQDMNNNFSKDYDEGLIFINPVIKSSCGKTTFLEGCDSCIFYRDDKKFYYTGMVFRPYKIEVEYFDINGNKITEFIEDFAATVFCHEYDNLNGVLHMDKVNEVFEMTLDDMKDYRVSHPYKVLSKF